MIKIADRYNLMPELFDLWPDQLVKCHDDMSDIDILGIWDKEAATSDQFTIIVCTEPYQHNAHIEYADLIRRRSNSVWAITSYTPDIEWQVGRTVFFASHLIMTIRINNHKQSWQPEIKQYLASALLGGWGRERSVLFSALSRENLLKHCLVNYRRRPGQDPDPNWANLAQEYQSPEIPALDNDQFTNQAYQQNGFNSCVPVDFGILQQNWISQIIPWRIYDKCWLSLVAETGTNSFMPSEKIAKPLLAGQPWMVLSCKFYLRQLRDLGFQTFHPLIDESYDEENSYRARIAAIIVALKQFERLDETEKLSRVRDMQPILEHNRRLMLDFTRWYDPIYRCIHDHAGTNA